MRSKLLFLTMLLFILIALFGCSSSGETEDTSVETDTTNEVSSTEGETKAQLPDQMVWSVYSTGAGTYADMAAIAEVFTQEYGTNIRLLPNDTGVGRMAPLRDGAADIGRVGEEYIYAFEGDLDFAVADWGPQDVRMIWGPITGSSIAIAVEADSGIETVADLKGKTIANIIANPSVENKMRTYLAYADLTYDDVNLVDLTYSDQVEAFKSGQIDAILFNPFGAAMFELASTMDIKWLDLDDDSPETWERVHEVAPSVLKGELIGGAGMEEGEVLGTIVYSVPIIAYADQDKDFVYNLAKALHEQFEKYKDATNVLYNHDINEILTEPLVVPFHDGVIEFFKEHGMWTEEAEKKNNELIERQKKLQEGWSEMDLSLDEETLRIEWEEWKENNLD